MSKDKKTIFTPKQLKEHDAITVGKTLTIMMGALVDEYDLEKQDLELVLDRFSRYADAVEEHLITLKVVEKIVEEQTGITLRWVNKG